MKAVVAFANCEGGSVYLGVRDDGAVVGVDLEGTRRAGFVRRVLAGLERDCSPALDRQVTFIFHDVVNRSPRQILELKVAPLRLAFSLCLYQRNCYMRRLASSVKLTHREIIELMLF
jgi:predicted HTH transcriptional regulator